MVIFFLSFFFAFSSLQANDFVDSLKNELKSVRSDSLELNIRKNIANYYAINNPDSADKYIDIFSKRAKMLDDKENIGEVFLLYSLKNAYKGDLNESNQELYKAEKYALKHNLEEQLNTVYLTLGINNLRLGIYDEAIEYLNKSLELAKSENNDELLGRTYTSLGIFYNKQGNYEKEEYYLKKALEIFIEENQYGNIATVYSNLGSNYAKTGKLDSAVYYLKNAADFYELKGRKQSISIVYHNLAAIYFELDSMNKAIDYLKKSIDIKKELNNKIGLANSEFGLGEIYFQTNKIDSARDLFNRSLEIYKESGMLRKQLITYHMLDSIAVLENNYREAYKNLKQAKLLQDSIYNERNREIIADYETKYDLAEKEKDNQILRAEAQKQRFIILIVLLVIMLVFVIAVILYIRHRSVVKINNLLKEKNDKIAEKNNKLKNLNRQLKQINKELKNLNATKDKFFAIISHDLKGPISSSYMLIDTVRKNYEIFTEDEKKENLDMLYDATYNTFLLLENLLTWSRTQRNKIDYGPEESYIKSVVSITIGHLLIFSEQKNITINNNIPADIRFSFDVNMMSTIFRNLINNSIKFTKENGEINVNFSEDKDWLIFSIEDNGIGMTKEIKDNLFKLDKTHSRNGTNNEKGTGLGLIIVLEFIQIHKGEISVESEPNKGTTFFIKLPKQQ